MNDSSTTAFSRSMPGCMLWIQYLKYIHRDALQLLDSKNQHRCYVGALPFWLTPPRHMRVAPGWHQPSSTTGDSLTLILGRHLLKPLHCWKNQLGLADIHQSGEESVPNMVLQRVHMEPFSMWHDRRSNRPPRYITYHGTIPMPTS